MDLHDLVLLVDLVENVFIRPSQITFLYEALFLPFRPHGASILVDANQVHFVREGAPLRTRELLVSLLEDFFGSLLVGCLSMDEAEGESQEQECQRNDPYSCRRFKQ